VRRNVCCLSRKVSPLVQDEHRVVSEVGRERLAKKGRGIRIGDATRIRRSGGGGRRKSSQQEAMSRPWLETIREEVEDDGCHIRSPLGCSREPPGSPRRREGKRMMGVELSRASSPRPRTKVSLVSIFSSASSSLSYGSLSGCSAPC
jgi:hypothetical protein